MADPALQDAVLVGAFQTPYTKRPAKEVLALLVDAIAGILRQHQNGAERRNDKITREDDENREDSERPESAQARGKVIVGEDAGEVPAEPDHRWR